MAQIMKKHGMKAFTSNTVTTLEALSDQLDEARRVGYAYDIEEISFGMCCVGAPVYNFKGEVVAALSFSVPTHRFHSNRDRYTKAIVAGAQQVSKQLGFHRLKTPKTTGDADKSLSVSTQ